MDFMSVLKEVFGSTEESNNKPKKLSEVKPPNMQLDFKDVFNSVFSNENVKTLVEDVIPGTSDVMSAKRTVDSLGEAGAAIRRGDVTGALKGYADAATNAVGALPMVPAIGGILTGARGAAKGVNEIVDREKFFNKDIIEKLKKWDNDTLNKEHTVQDIYNNEELFNLYPEVKNTKVIFDDIDGAGYDPDTDTITMDWPLNTTHFIHELQHKVDFLENRPETKIPYKKPEGPEGFQAYIDQPLEKRARTAEERLVKD